MKTFYIILREKFDCRQLKKITFLILISLIVISVGFNRYYSNCAEKFSDEFKIASVIGNDDRVRITPTTSYPWSTIVKLHLTWNDYYSYGTGVLIDENHVLTAGHCVYSHSYGGWPDSIKVVPGEENGNEPYGHAWVTKMRTYIDWMENASFEHDFALLTLDRDIGVQTGWMGVYTTVASSSTYTSILDTAGYPYELDGGTNLYWCSDYGISASECTHRYKLDTTGGQSGSPVWIYKEKGPYVVSIVTYGYIGLDINFGTRINQNKYYCLQNWLTADETLTDKADLTFEYNKLAGYNTTIVGAGLTEFKVWSRIRNLGTSQANSIKVSYYASEDTAFTKEDYLIGIDTITSLSPTESAASHWSGTFPNIPSGNYYIGWIVDDDNVIQEFNENNNYNFIWNSKVLVDGSPPTNPTSCAQLIGTTESGVLQNSINNPNFNWSGATDSHTEIKGYYYYWGEDPNGESAYFTAFPNYDPPAVNNGTYYLRICTKDIVGNISPWTTLYIFKYEQKPDNPNDNPIDDPVDDPPENPDDGNEDPPDNVIKDNDINNFILDWILSISIIFLLILLFLKVHLKK
jgi:glutamyl endopeptidase